MQIKDKTEEEYLTEFEYICHEVENGIAVRKACTAFMSSKKFYSLMEGSEDLRKRYAHACEVRAENMFEEMLEISDSSNADVTISEEGKALVDGEAIQRSKLKIDTRKWMLAKMAPKKYGDKIEVDGGLDLKHVVVSLGSGINPDEAIT